MLTAMQRGATAGGYNPANLGTSAAFGPLGRADAPITRAQRAASRRVDRAQRAAEKHVVLPAIPRLANPTGHQRGVATQQVSMSAHAQGISTPQEVRNLPAAQRQRANRAAGYARTQARDVAVKIAESRGATGGTRRQRAQYGREIIRANRAEAKPGPPHMRLQLAGVGPQVDLTSLGRTIAAATTLNRGDLGPRTFVKGALGDIGTLATAPFVGGVELAHGGYDLLRHGDPNRLEALAKGVAQGIEQGFGGQLVQGHWNQAVEQFRHHPVMAGLDLAAGAGVAGRAAGALARGAGAAAEAGGVRGALGRAGSTVRPPLALSDDPAAAANGLLHERAYSKDLGRKTGQVIADQLREPLRDANGKIVTVVQRGRRVPVLQATAREREHLLRRRGDFSASRANSVERMVRDEASRTEHSTRASRHVRDRLPNELVSMAIEGTLRSPRTFEQDLRSHRAALEQAFERGGFRHSGEQAANRERAAFIDKVLASPRALGQSESVFRAAERQAAHLNVREAEAVRLGLVSPGAAQRARLIPWAIEHMGARHVSVEEHGRREAAARKLESAALERATALPKAKRKAALAEWRRLREHRIAVSGRDPAAVQRHEMLQALARNSASRAKRAEMEVARLERSRQRLVGAQSVQRGETAAKRMHAGTEAPNRASAVLRYIDKAAGDEVALRRGAAREGQRAKVLAKVERRLAEARAAAREARASARTDDHAARASTLPPARPGVRSSDGRILRDSEIAADIRKHRGEDGLATVAYLPHRLDVRGARSHHTQFRVGNRPLLDQETRTGEAYRRGSTDFVRALVHDEFARKEIQIAKAEQIDRFIAEHALRHPAWAKSRAGDALTSAERRIVTRGGYFTANEALEVADRLEHDSATRYVPVHAFGAKVSADTQRAIREEMQNPRAFESLGQRLLNDRIINPNDAHLDRRARNVVLVPAPLIERLDRHLQPAGDFQRFLQFVNRAFRASVLPQPRWLTGNAFEPFVVRLTASGSGLNVFGLGADVRAAVKTVRAMERSGDPKLRQAAREIRAQQFGGLLIGGRGASVRRTAEDLPGVLKTGAVVRHLPVVKQLGDLAGGLLNSYFRANRVIEALAQRAALGRSIREDLQAFSGSWLKTVTLGKDAAEEAARGLVQTATQERFMRAQHELLGQYEGFSPAVRELVQGAFPFAPWAVAAARFTFWTMPAHHTVLTDTLVKTEQTIDQEWQEQHTAVPPGALELALPRPDGGWVDVARYTPYGFSGPLVKGDLQVVTDQAFPQFSGALAAAEGRDPFGRQLQLQKGKAEGLGDKGKVAAYQLLEALVPYLSTARRLQEHGETAYADSTVFAPKTKPGTSHGMSAARRTFDPFRPTYLKGSAAGGAAGDAGGMSAEETRMLLREADYAAGGATQEPSPDEIRALLREAEYAAGR